MRNSASSMPRKGWRIFSRGVGRTAQLAESALRGAFESTGTYATQTELAELAAAGWDAAGVKDSALVRYRQVASNWAHADPMFGPRVERARLRIAALSGQ